MDEVILTTCPREIRQAVENILNDPHSTGRPEDHTLWFSSQTC
jgi:hypothetical protein